MVLRTTTERARWNVIPANDKYSARIEVLKQVTKGLRRALGDD